MESISIDGLDALLEKGRQLREILRETPEIVSFLQLVKDTGGKASIVPLQEDRLIRAGEAASILCVDKGTIYRYEREGKLEAFYTDGSSQKKFWLSRVMKLPKRAAKAKEVK